MKYLLIIFILFSCNALELMTNQKSKLDPSFRNDSNQNAVILSQLNWTNGHIQNVIALDINWQNSGDSQMHELKYSTYLSNDCSGNATNSNLPLSITDVNANISIPGADGPRTFELVAYDVSGVEIQRVCSPVVNIDTTAPAAATGSAWAHPSPTNVGSISSSWNAPSGDIARQEIKYFSDGTCTTVLGSATEISLGSSSNTYNTPSDATSYTFVIIFYDHAGNSTQSSCSSSLLVDYSPPMGATSLAWTNSTGTAPANIQPMWTLSAAPDILSQEVHYFSDASCTTTALTANLSLTNTDTTTNHASTPAGSYYFHIITRDNAGNINISPCNGTATVISI